MTGIRNVLRGYGGLGLLIAGGSLLFGTAAMGIIVSAAQLRYPSAAVLTAEYAVIYWEVRWQAVVAVLVVSSVLAAFGVPSRLYFSYFRGPLYWNIDFRLRRARRQLTFICFGLSAIVWSQLVPLLFLYYPGWVLSVAAGLPGILGVVAYLVLLGNEVEHGRAIRSLARDKVDQISWSAAALGVHTRGTADELKAYIQATKHGPTSELARGFIRAGSEGSRRWEGNDSFIRLLAQFLACDPSSLELFDRTTGAVEAALQEILSDGARVGGEVVVTDAEYPSVAKVAQRLDEGDPGVSVKKVELRTKLLSQRIGLSEVERLILEKINENTRAVILSHVFYESGVELSLQRLVRRIKEKVGGAKIIVDGAQALGNIRLESEVLDAVDYYAGCGHKWLGGTPTLGILVRNPRLVPTRTVRPGARSLSRLGDTELGGTINIEAHVSLNSQLHEFLRIGMDAIAKHNAELARVLVSRLEREYGWKSVRIVPTNGIATFRLALEQASRVGGVLSATRCDATILTDAARDDAMDDPAGSAAVRGVRFCCHYYQSERDIYDLAARIHHELHNP